MKIERYRDVWLVTIRNMYILIYPELDVYRKLVPLFKIGKYRIYIFSALTCTWSEANYKGNDYTPFSDEWYGADKRR